MLKLIIASLLFSLSAQGKVFRNAYISFEMPETWKCNLEQTEWVCRSEMSKESKEAIIILTAKEVGPTDSLELYESHLGAPIRNTLRGSGPESQVIYKAKRVQINDQPWIDGLHSGSEVPNYFTRYLATIKDRIAVLVTFSAHKQFYTKYAADFFKAVSSLRVIASKNLLSKPDLGPIRPGSETLGGPIGQAMPGDMFSSEQLDSSGGGDKSLYLGLAAILAAVGIFIYLRSKKKR